MIPSIIYLTLLLLLAITVSTIIMCSIGFTILVVIFGIKAIIDNVNSKKKKEKIK